MPKCIHAAMRRERRAESLVLPPIVDPWDEFDASPSPELPALLALIPATRELLFDPRIPFDDTTPMHHPV